MNSSTGPCYRTMSAVALCLYFFCCTWDVNGLLATTTERALPPPPPPSPPAITTAMKASPAAAATITKVPPATKIRVKAAPSPPPPPPPPPPPTTTGYNGSTLTVDQFPQWIPMTPPPPPLLKVMSPPPDSPEYVCGGPDREPPPPGHDDIPSCSYYARMLTCEGHCGNVSSQRGGIPKWCSCDHLCYLYGDCCPDVEAKCPDEKTKYELRKTTLNFNLSYHPGATCQTLKYRFASIYMSSIMNVLVFGKCPTDWVSDTILDACEIEGNPWELDLKYILPVTDKNTGVHFRNAYCATCHGIENYTFWQVNFNCSRPVYLENSSNPFIELEKSDACTKTIIPPSWSPIRTCEHVIRECSKDCSNEKMIRDCHRYQLYIENRDSYKNKFCALCNHENLPDLRCKPVTAPSGKPGTDISFFSFRVIMDFNSLDGLRIGVNTQQDEGDIAGRETLLDCHVFDASCQPIQCSLDFKLVEGVCMYKYPLSDVRIVTSWVTKDPNERLTFVKGSPFQKIPYFKEQKADIARTLSKIFETGFPVYGTVVTNYVDTFNPRAATMESRFLLKSIEANVTQSQINATIILSLDIALESIISVFNNDSKKIFKYVGNTYSFGPFHSGVSDCPRIGLNTSDYDILGNGSILVHVSNTLIDRKDYQVWDNRAWVCADAVNISEELLNNNSTGNSQNVDYLSQAEGIVTVTFLIISSLCILIRIVLQPCVAVFRTFPGRLQFCLVFVLFISKVLFLMRPFFLGNEVGCQVIAVLFHWSVLCSFLWMNAIAVDMTRTFSTKSSLTSDRSEGSRKRFLTYHVFTLLCSVIVVVSCLVLDYAHIDENFQPSYTSGVCWISKKFPLIIFMVAPIGLVIIVNLILFVIISRSIRGAMKRAEGLSSSQNKNHSFAIYVKIFVLMGVNWIFGFVASLFHDPTVSNIMWYIFIVTATLDGVYIFIATVCTKRVWEELKKLNGLKTCHLTSDSTPLNSVSSNTCRNSMPSKKRSTEVSSI
ncbi:uncharacterized protein LOC106158924 [Lingula anatina]|uniref:Uncharacterized protein LOC106158924 n=1 Tax=Lingula anatina TaxID=7574 RepID=A0A1S3HWV8_LINAN|nr:uncharacterized protein LOC106158924 [Lingula anatina]XP_013390515.1 uncharacterized protein LOC106158924 [Lingula anatina]XP_013390524.1 uncharacterized protein LOC106158924 [Lingula anatina]|eukprot:XP_013390509.1 uncharacterized protein LOC106158924 [Lingula anatina]